MLKLFLDLHSQPCRAVFMFAKAVGIPFEFKLVDLISGQQHSEEFGKINIVRKVPVMQDGNFILTESIAILRYLAKKHSSTVPDHWYPADLQQQARVDEYMAWQHTTLRTHGSMVAMLLTLVPMVGLEVSKQKMDVAVEDLNQSLNLLEEKFLANKPFIIGDKISLADVVALAEAMEPVGCGMDVFKNRPKLTAWRERVKKAVGEKLFDETNESLMKISNLKLDSITVEVLKSQVQRMLI